MCDFKLCILLEFKKEMSKHAERHLFGFIRFWPEK